MPPEEGSNNSNTNATPMQRVNSETDFSEAEGGASGKEYRVKKSSLIGMINWGHVFEVYYPQIYFVAFVALVAQLVHQFVTSRDLFHFHFLPAAKDLYATVLNLATLPYSPYIKTTIVILVIVGWLARKENPVYLLSFATFKAPESWRISHEQLIQIMKNQKCYTDDSLAFLKRLLERSGTGQATAWPPGIIKCLEADNTQDATIEESRKEAETVIFDVVEKVLKQTGVKPQEIDILVINCSLFNPTPSLCAMVVNRFNLRPDCMTYNLSGMGCSASLISIDLAKHLLQSRAGRRGSLPFGGGGIALVVSTEIITPNLYKGNERAFLLQNTLFRCGAAGMLLSSKWSDGRRAWYKLLHTIRVQGIDDNAYKCVYETQDQSGAKGVALSKDIVKVAGKTMEKNLTRLGPLVLPLSEQAKVVLSIIGRKVVKFITKISPNIGKKLPIIKVYIPDFKRGIDHFCIHAGGRAVIDGIEKNMNLQPYHTEPSRMALLNYGNTSSSSIWYELEYIQDVQKSNKLSKGDRILQVAFGSGFKCTSAVWLKL